MSTDAQTETDWVEAIGKPAYDSLAEMMAALEVDYDRLEELREERDGWEQPDGYACSSWDEDSETDADDVDELAKLEEAAGECESEDDARQRIQEDPLSLRIFGELIDGEWEADNYELLLGTGGPAVRIVGDLGEHKEPTSARLEVQDWFKPWTEYSDENHDDNMLLAYACCFCQ